MKNKKFPFKIKGYFLKKDKTILKAILIVGFILGLVIFSQKYTYNIDVTENQYFWILGSYVQGFATLVGIIIASLAIIGTNKFFSKKIKVKHINKTFSKAIGSSLLTIISSIFAMVLYNFVKARFPIILMVSGIALWCIMEIYIIMYTLLSE